MRSYPSITPATIDRAARHLAANGIAAASASGSGQLDEAFGRRSGQGPGHRSGQGPGQGSGQGPGPGRAGDAGHVILAHDLWDGRPRDDLAGRPLVVLDTCCPLFDAAAAHASHADDCLDGFLVFRRARASDLDLLSRAARLLPASLSWRARTDGAAADHAQALRQAGALLDLEGDTPATVGPGGYARALGDLCRRRRLRHLDRYAADPPPAALPLVLRPRYEDYLPFYATVQHRAPPTGGVEALARGATTANARRCLRDVTMLFEAIAAVQRDGPRGRPVRVLDIGSGSGQLPAMAAAMAARTLGTEVALTLTDFSPAQVEVLRHRAPPCAGVTIAAEPLEPDSLAGGRKTHDIVSSFQVLEHVADPTAFLAAKARAARRMIVTSTTLEEVWGHRPNRSHIWTFTEGAAHDLAPQGFRVAGTSTTRRDTDDRQQRLDFLHFVHRATGP